MVLKVQQNIFCLVRGSKEILTLNLSLIECCHLMVWSSINLHESCKIEVTQLESMTKLRTIEFHRVETRIIELVSKQWLPADYNIH